MVTQQEVQDAAQHASNLMLAKGSSTDPEVVAAQRRYDELRTQYANQPTPTTPSPTTPTYHVTQPPTQEEVSQATLDLQAKEVQLKLLQGRYEGQVRALQSGTVKTPEAYDIAHWYDPYKSYYEIEYLPAYTKAKALSDVYNAKVQMENVLAVTSQALKAVAQQNLVTKALGLEGVALLTTPKMTIDQQVAEFNANFQRGLFPGGAGGVVLPATVTAMASLHLQTLLKTTAYDPFGRKTPSDIAIKSLQLGVVWPEEIKTKPLGIYYKEGVQEEPNWAKMQQNLFEEHEAAVNELLLFGESAWYRVREAIPIPYARDVAAGFVRGAEGIVAPIVQWKMGAQLPQPVHEVGGLFESPVGVPGISVAQPEPILTFVGEMLFYQGLFMAGITGVKALVGAPVKMTEALVGYAKGQMPTIGMQWEVTKVGITGAKEGIISGVLGSKVAELSPEGYLLQYRTGGFFEPIVYPYQMLQFKAAEFMAGIGKGIPYLLPGEIPMNIASKALILKPYEVVSVLPGGIFETRLAATSIWHAYEPSGKFFGLVTPVTPTSIGWSTTEFSKGATRINTFLNQVSSTEMLSVKVGYEKIGANVLFPISEISEPAWASLRLGITYLPPYERMVGGYKPSIVEVDYTAFGKQITETTQVAWLDKKQVPQILQQMMGATWMPPSEVPVSRQITGFLASFEPRAVIEPYKVAGAWGKTPIWKSTEDAMAVYANPKKWATLYRSPTESVTQQPIVPSGRQSLVLELPTVETPAIVSEAQGVQTVSWARDAGMTGQPQLNWAQQALLYKRQLQIEYLAGDYGEAFSPFIAHPLIAPLSLAGMGVLPDVMAKSMVATKDIQKEFAPTKDMLKAFQGQRVGQAELLLNLTNVGIRTDVGTTPIQASMAMQKQELAQELATIQSLKQIQQPYQPQIQQPYQPPYIPFIPPFEPEGAMLWPRKTKNPFETTKKFLRIWPIRTLEKTFAGPKVKFNTKNPFVGKPKRRPRRR